MDQETLTKRKLMDAAKRAYHQNQYTFTNFLDLSEQNIYHQMHSELGFISSDSYGGNDSCERQIVRFGSEQELGYDLPYPIDLLCIRPLIQKFSDTLSHRDYLGAILNLGIERSLIGDIIVREDASYVFCMNHITDFIIDHLATIKHTHIKCELTDTRLENITPVLSDLEIICASARIDAVVASISKLSRSRVLELFRTHKVYVNGQEIENNSAVLHSGDVLVIRGNGKYIFTSVGQETRKGRVYIQLKKYV